MVCCFFNRKNKKRCEFTCVPNYILNKFKILIYDYNKKIVKNVTKLLVNHKIRTPCYVGNSEHTFRISKNDENNYAYNVERE